MKNLLKLLQGLIRLIFSNNETPVKTQPPVVVNPPVVKPEPEPPVVSEPAPDPVIIPTEPPIVVEPVPTPDPVEPPVKSPEPVAEVDPVPETVKEPDPVIVPVTPDPEPVTPPAAKTLRDVPIFMTCAFKDNKINDEKYKVEILKNFRGIVPENSLHMGTMNPAKGKFDFSRPDPIVKWALKNNLRVDGTCLLWPHQTKSWVKNGNFSKDELLKIFTDYIHTCVSHFKGKVSSWVVVNEFLEDDGRFKACPWLDAWGQEYIPMALEIAHKADPAAKLFVGDYSLEYATKKVTVLLDLIKGWQKRGVPLHGISSQMHSVVRMDVKNFNENLKKFAATGLLFYVSELDVEVKKDQKSTIVKELVNGVMTEVKKLFLFSEDLKKKHAAFYVAVGQGLMKYMPEKQRYGINVWSMTHRQNFMNLDENGKPRPADYPSMFEDDYTPNLAAKEFIDKVK